MIVVTWWSRLPKIQRRKIEVGKLCCFSSLNYDLAKPTDENSVLWHWIARPRPRIYRMCNNCHSKLELQRLSGKSMYAVNRFLSENPVQSTEKVQIESKRWNLVVCSLCEESLIRENRREICIIFTCFQIEFEVIYRWRNFFYGYVKYFQSKLAMLTFILSVILTS